MLFEYNEILGVIENEIDICNGIRKVIRKKFVNILRMIKWLWCSSIKILNEVVFRKKWMNYTKENMRHSGNFILKSGHGKKVKLQTLRHQYELFEMNNSETVSCYIHRVIPLTTLMKSYEDEIKEQSVVKRL